MGLAGGQNLFEQPSWLRHQCSGIPNSINHRGLKKFPRPSRSKYNPVQEDIKHGISR